MQSTPPNFRSMLKDRTGPNNLFCIDRPESIRRETIAEENIIDDANDCERCALVIGAAAVLAELEPGVL